jgi:predicted translin family RNA/ssDNA-binding protein
MIGATTGDKPDYVADEDLKTLDELRGAMQDLDTARLSLNEKATVEGIMRNQDVLRQQLEMTHEQMQRVIGMYSTLRAEFDQFQKQRVIELQSWLAKGGSTTPEDMTD